MAIIYLYHKNHAHPHPKLPVNTNLKQTGHRNLPTTGRGAPERADGRYTGRCTALVLGAGRRQPPGGARRPGQGRAGQERPGTPVPQGATVTGIVRGWRRREQLPGHLGAPGSPKSLPRPPECPGSGGGGCPAPAAPGGTETGTEGRRKESERVGKGPHRALTAYPGGPRGTGARSAATWASAWSLPRQNPKPAAAAPVPPQPGPPAPPTAASAGRAPRALLRGAPGPWGAEGSASRAPCAGFRAAHGLAAPAKGVCGSWGAAPGSAGDRSWVALTSGSSAVTIESRKVNRFSVDKI